PVAFQVVELEAELLQLALQGLLAGEQLRLVGAEGLQQTAQARLAALQLEEIALQQGEIGAQVGKALDQLAVANPLCHLLGAEVCGRRGDAVFFEDGGNHRLDGLHLALARMHGAHQLLDMAQAVLAAAPGELARQLAQFAALAVGGQQGTVVLDERPVLAGIELVADGDAQRTEMAAQLVHGAADDAVALAAADVVLQIEALVYQAIVHAPAIAAGCQDRLARLVVHALVFVDDEALLGGQIPALETVAGGRHHAARILAVEHRHQALQGGLAGRVGATDVGVVVHHQLDDTLEVGVDQDEAIQAGHVNPSRTARQARSLSKLRAAAESPSGGAVTFGTICRAVAGRPAPAKGASAALRAKLFQGAQQYLDLGDGFAVLGLPFGVHDDAAATPAADFAILDQQAADGDGAVQIAAHVQVEERAAVD